jgi:hypothetical protein
LANGAQEPEYFAADDAEAVSLIGRRSNCHLDSSKLLAEYPNIPNVRVALETAMRQLARATSL